ncbi:EpsG family protein [Microbacterium oleivorans]|uniref:EpsG family protein n=1 Tax=Microbacterium oleivorans TaxID=273677 RepID=UPI00166FFA09|nr:EpsG family protein [Microbacterium oleivorans]
MSTSAAVFIVVLGIAGAVLLPVATIPIVLLGVLATYRYAPQALAVATMLTVAALFAWTNAGKGIMGDWGWYVQHYQVLEYTPFSEYIGARIGAVTAEANEPVYYLVADALAKATGANVAVLAIVITLITYITIGTAVFIAVLSVTDKRVAVIAAVTVGMMMGLTFTLSTQLVRQEMAAAFIGLSLVLVAKRRLAIAIPVGLIAVLTHNSALIPAAGVAAAWLIGRGVKHVLIRWVLIGGIFYGLGRLYLTRIGFEYTGQNDGSISTAVIALDVVIFVAFATLLRQQQHRDPIAHFVLMAVPSFYGFVLGVASQPLPLLRMYFYVEVLRALMLAFIVVFLMKARWSALLGILAIAVGFIYVELRIAQSPFHFDLTMIQIITQSPFLGP